jgi:tetratricopeptide (TPR) repeat protein
VATLLEALAIAHQHHQAGRRQAAEQIYRQILAVDPAQPDALHLLGVMALEAGKYEAAIEYIGQAIRLNGSVAAFHNNLGSAFERHGKLNEAIACYRRALELEPDIAEAYYNLGIALKDQENLDEAVACFRRAVELRPYFVDAHNNLANALRHQGKLDEALACYRRALELKPNYVEAHNNLGNALKDQGLLNEAVACYRRALQLKPDYAEAYFNLGNAFLDQEKLDEAVAASRRALELKPDYAEAHNNLGIALRDQNKMDEAVACFQRALALKPNYAEAQLSLGELHIQLGEMAEAELAFRAALELQPAFAPAHACLATLLRGQLPEADRIALEERIAEPRLNQDSRARLSFALAYVSDARGEYDRAADFLRQANALRLELNRGYRAYLPAEHEQFVDNIIKTFDRPFFARVAGAGLDTCRPVFVVGLPRSGTSLIEQVLASHSRIHGAGELPLVAELFEGLPAMMDRSGPPLDCVANLDAPALRRLGGHFLDRIGTIDGGRSERIIDKLPENYLHLGLLAAMFPRAVLIHCRRDLRDVAVSCWMTDFRNVRWANDPQHVASRFRQYRRLMDHWHTVLPVPIHDVDYEDVVVDLEPVARRLLAACGLDWEPACLEFHRTRRPVRTPSGTQVRQPVYTQSVARWKNYERELADLFATLPE